MSQTQLKIESKSVKHKFTPAERDQLGGDLARSIGGIRSIEAEFDQVKADYKAKLAEAEATINRLSTCLVNGFDIRLTRCVVVFNVKMKKKHYFVEEEWNRFEQAEKDGLKVGDELGPVLTEDMTAEDFQQELIQAESIFDNKSEIQLFPPARSQE